MAGLNETPSGNRIRIAFFGLRNAGKSTLVNAFTGQEIAIVSPIAGTTTDPVSKAMEILPLGPCVITDTAGLDDEGALGRQRVERTLSVLETTDIAVWVEVENAPQESPWKARFLEVCRGRNIPIIEYHRGEDVAALRERIASLSLGERQIGLLEGLVKRGDRVLCIVPIDESAPKGRLILPQQQVIRECLDRGAVCTVAQPGDIRETNFDLAITDSQAFGLVRGKFPRLTSFSVLFARQKGDLAEYLKGVEAIARLKDGDKVLIAEGCTHHRQCNDIGSVKIPKALQRLSGRNLEFVFSSGVSFDPMGVALVVQCGGCMLTRREVMRRIEICRATGVPIANYGLVLARANGIDVKELVV